MEDFKDILEEPKYKKYYKYIIGGIIILVLVIIMVIVSIVNQKENKKTKQVVENSNIQVSEPKEEIEVEEPILYKVDIKGKVNNPGVYELVENSRVTNVIDMAGGLTEDADTSLINLSKKIKDEMVIIIYSKDEINKQKEKSIEYVYVMEECNCPDNINDACINISKDNNTKDNSTKDSETSENENQEEVNNLISINKATSEELQTLSGIGESKAKSIIEYREKNGDFKNIEDIKNVSGIGDSVYEKIKDYITV